MIRFTINGEKHEFDESRLMVKEAIDLGRFVPLTTQEFGAGLKGGDPTALCALVWLTLRREGQSDLDFTAVDFDLVELGESLSDDSEKEPDDESDPTSDDLDPATS